MGEGVLKITSRSSHGAPSLKTSMGGGTKVRAWSTRLKVPMEVKKWWHHNRFTTLWFTYLVGWVASPFIWSTYAVWA